MGNGPAGLSKRAFPLPRLRLPLPPSISDTQQVLQMLRPSSSQLCSRVSLVSATALSLTTDTLGLSLHRSVSLTLTWSPQSNRSGCLQKVTELGLPCSPVVKEFVLQRKGSGLPPWSGSWLHLPQSSQANVLQLLSWSITAREPMRHKERSRDGDPTQPSY